MSHAAAGTPSFSRSAIHYYFDSVDEIVDAAMAGQLEEFIATLRAIGAEHDDPADRFWAVRLGYVGYFAEQPALTLLWFDYSIAAGQAGRPEPVIGVETTLRGILGELLEACGVADHAARAEALTAFMFGTTLRGVLHPGSTAADLEGQLATLSGLPR